MTNNINASSNFANTTRHDHSFISIPANYCNICSTQEHTGSNIAFLLESLHRFFPPSANAICNRGDIVSFCPPKQFYLTWNLFLTELLQLVKQGIWNIPSCHRINASWLKVILHGWKWSTVKLLTQKIRISPHKGDVKGLSLDFKRVIQRISQKVQKHSVNEWNNDLELI